MTAGLGDKKSEVFHEIDADRFFGVILRTLDRFPDRWVEIFFSSPELEEERLMIDPGAEEGDFVIGDIDPFSEHLAGSLNAVAKPDVRTTGCGVYRPAICRHRVDVVQQQRVRRKIVKFEAKIDQDRDGPERSKYTARTERIADALFHAVFLRDLDIQSCKPPGRPVEKW